MKLIERQQKFSIKHMAIFTGIIMIHEEELDNKLFKYLITQHPVQQISGALFLWYVTIGWKGLVTRR